MTLQANKENIKLSGDIAWEEKMEPECDCGASQRSECVCRRSDEFKQRAEELRENWFGEEWANPIQAMIEEVDQW